MPTLPEVVPTFDKTDTFQRDYEKLSNQDKHRFKAALRAFIDDLEAIDNGTRRQFDMCAVCGSGAIKRARQSETAIGDTVSVLWCVFWPCCC